VRHPDWRCQFHELVPDRKEETHMTTRFQVGDRVSWNSEAGRVTGHIIRVHTSDFDYKGYTHHATSDDPQYEIKRDKTDHIAAHKGSALRKISSGDGDGEQVTETQ
jgi:hypothetical protein